MKRVRLVKRADGYYVQFAVQADRQIAHEPTGIQVGIDVGLKAYYTDSTGVSVQNPRHLPKSERRQTPAPARLAQAETLQESEEGHPTVGKKTSQSE